MGVEGSRPGGFPFMKPFESEPGPFNGQLKPQDRQEPAATPDPALTPHRDTAAFF